MKQLRKEIQYVLEKNNLYFAEKIVEMQYKLQEGYWKQYGATGKKLSIRDAGYHLPFLSESVLTNDPTIFKEYVAWVKTLFRGLKFPDSVMIETLKCTGKVLQKELRDELYVLIKPVLDAGIEQMQMPVEEPETYIDDSTDMGILARRYNNALLAGNRNLASELIMEEVKKGASIKNIYLEVFQKSQYEVGRLWLSNQITVAKEHFCSAATQMIMSQLYPHIFNTERIGKTFIGASIGGELHEIGIRMVADFFEMSGWDTYYLGANAPASTILNAIDDNNADIVGLSIAMPYHRRILADTISEIRKSSSGKDVKILIGGVALKNKIGIETFDANAYAKDAQDAINVANKLTA